uniref:Uncharacterized LOC100184939 n=1 Tax=Ciona intestinalis TaxID=7719 RepID=H2XV02_CIOIN|nr:uncharacterized protein LOC100184939 [Ciona intestinalis]|eukprot:XP_026691157.1 uncharacterized protein LOC100184939 [Ciona intestinalis]
MDRDLSQQLVKDHLSNGTGQETWLIPFGVTVALALGVIVVMILHHFVKQYRRNPETDEERSHQGYKEATTDSDEGIAFTAVRDETDSRNTVPVQIVGSQEHNSRLVVESRRVEVHSGWSAPPPDYSNVPNLLNMPSSNL